MKIHLLPLPFILILFACSPDSTSTSNNTPSSSTESISSPIALKSGSTSGKLIDIEEGDYKYLHVQDEKSGQLFSFMLIERYEGIDTFPPEKASSFKGKKIQVDWEETLINIPEAGGEIKTVMVTAVTILE